MRDGLFVMELPWIRVRKTIRALCSLLPPHTGLLFSGFGSPLLFLFCSLTSFLLFLSTDFTVCVFVFCLPLQWDFRVSSVTSFPSSLEFQFDARFFFLTFLRPLYGGHTIRPPRRSVTFRSRRPSCHLFFSSLAFLCFFPSLTTIDGEFAIIRT